MYIEYTKPFLAVPKNESLKPYIYELELMVTDGTKFEYFNRPNGEAS